MAGDIKKTKERTVLTEFYMAGWCASVLHHWTLCVSLFQTSLPGSVLTYHRLKTLTFALRNSFNLTNTSFNLLTYGHPKTSRKGARCRHLLLSHPYYEPRSFRLKLSTRFLLTWKGICEAPGGTNVLPFLKGLVKKLPSEDFEAFLTSTLHCISTANTQLTASTLKLRFSHIAVVMWFVDVLRALSRQWLSAQLHKSSPATVSTSDCPKTVAKNPTQFGDSSLTSREYRSR